MYLTVKLKLGKGGPKDPRERKAVFIDCCTHGSTGNSLSIQNNMKATCVKLKRGDRTEMKKLEGLSM